MIEITCPSGLRGVLRGMKVKDEQLFTDRKLVKSGRVISQLLQACWEKTLDPGPYTFEGAPDWDQALSADRTYALIQLRIASYGPKYEFRVMCGSGSCKNHFAWAVDLDLLNMTPVSEAGLRHVKSREPIAIKLSDERVVKTRLLTGVDEEFFSKLGTKDEAKFLTYHLARRIVEIEGKTHWSDVLTVVENLEARLADALWDMTDELEGGMDVVFSIECPSCGSIQQMTLPFEAGFFSSRKRFAYSQKSETGTR